MRGYTKAKLLSLVESASENISTFYKQNFVNYRGCTTDTGELYSEVIALWCLEHKTLFEKIPSITRLACYKTKTHDGIPKNPSSNREEELIAMELYRGGSLKILGEIIDYQTPLKNQRSDIAGKIDLLSYDGKTLRILELKEPHSEETMLRCVLEGYTYLSTVDKAKLLKDFKLPQDTKIVSCPLVFYGEAQYEEMKEDRPHLKRLMEELEATAYYIRKTNDTWEVTF